MRQERSIVCDVLVIDQWFGIVGNKRPPRVVYGGRFIGADGSVAPWQFVGVQALHFDADADLLAYKPWYTDDGAKVIPQELS